jgi:NAD+ diphosphatase
LNFTHVYSGNPVDRGEKERRDDQWIADKAKDATSKFLPLRDLNVLVTDGEDRLGWIGAADLNRLDINSSPVFLGLLGETAHFTVDISAQNKAVAELSNGNGYRFVDARSVTEILSGPDSGIVAQARSQINWHNRNGFCAICGGESYMIRGGQVRKCSKCETENYPRTDPVIIVVVSDGDR